MRPPTPLTSTIAPIRARATWSTGCSKKLLDGRMATPVTHPLSDSERQSLVILHNWRNRGKACHVDQMPPQKQHAGIAMAQFEATAHSQHIEETIRSIEELHAKHKEQATPLQRGIDWLTGLIARPSFVILLTVVVAHWIAFNLLAAQFGYQPIDRPPFPWLEGGMTLVS